MANFATNRRGVLHTPTFAIAVCIDLDDSPIILVQKSRYPALGVCDTPLQIDAYGCDLIAKNGCVKTKTKRAKLKERQGVRNGFVRVVDITPTSNIPSRVVVAI